MSDEVVVTPVGYKENPDLMPALMKTRTYNPWTFTMMMFSMNTCIPMFFLGPIAVGQGLNFWQALLGALIGNLAAVLVMWWNGQPGLKYGINYPVQLRESFGFRGKELPVILRGLAGTMWFGIEAYAGSLALMMIVFAIGGLPADQATAMAYKWLILALVVYLGSFIVVMLFGLKGIGRMADFAGPLMLIYFIWFVIFLATNKQFTPNIPKLWQTSVSIFSMNFLIYLAVQTNWWATVALNVSDLSRGIDPKKRGTFLTGLMIGIVVGQIIGTALGYAASQLTGEVLPQVIILKYAPGIIPALLGLIFAFVAPWSTDMTANSPALINILMSTFRARWKVAVVVSAVVAFLIAPWWLPGGGAYYTYINNFAANYGILLGPIAGIMMANYYVIRKKNFNLQKLYTYGKEGCWYVGGWSMAAIIALVVTWIICYLIAIPTKQMAYIVPGANGQPGLIPFPGGITWYPAVVISFFAYWLFAKILKE